jgi:hypothetical protein
MKIIHANLQDKGDSFLESEDFQTFDISKSID